MRLDVASVRTFPTGISERKDFSISRTIGSRLFFTYYGAFLFHEVLNVIQTVTEECASKIYGNKVPFNESFEVYRLSPMLLHVMIKSRVKLTSANI